MVIISDKKFNKKFLKLSKKVRDKFHERMDIFKNNQFEKILNNHSLHGEYEGCRSINIKGNYRAVYRTIDDKKDDIIYIFVTIGTHSELYE